MFTAALVRAFLSLSQPAAQGRYLIFQFAHPLHQPLDPVDGRLRLRRRQGLLEGPGQVDVLLAEPRPGSQVPEQGILAGLGDLEDVVAADDDFLGIAATLHQLFQIPVDG